MEPSETVPLAAARADLAALVDRARTEHRPVYLSRRGRRVAALVDADDLDRLLDLAEDVADVRAAAEARADMERTGETPVPWEDVKAELGLA